MNKMQCGLTSPRVPKRERDEDDNIEKPPCLSDPKELNQISFVPSIESNKLEKSLTRGSSHDNRSMSPTQSHHGILSDADTMTPSKTPNSPTSAPVALNDTVQPPKKRTKLSFAEKEEKRLVKSFREKEKADQKAEKEAERRAKGEERARKFAEKDAERKKKEADKEQRRLTRETEKAEKEQERKAKDDEKRRKEQDKQQLEDEKRKKERAQPKLKAFFKASNTGSKEDSPGKPRHQTSDSLIAPASAVAAESSNVKNTTSFYEEKFHPFFIQSSVKVAPTTRFARDEKASQALQNTIDSYIHGRISLEDLQPFKAVQLFKFPRTGLKSRGRITKPVREIMLQILGDASPPIDLTTDSQHLKVKKARDLLKTIPFKILSFHQDIRPPYKGTYTGIPTTGMYKMARSPSRQDLPRVNYDYDSEAEWEVEDGEDIESEADEDEDVGEGEEDLDEFLDDAEAETVNARKLIHQTDLEPQCSGLCWEDENRCGPDEKMCGYAIELITEDADICFPIDPLATHYWNGPTTTGLMEPPRAPLNAMKATNANLNSSNSPLKLLGMAEFAKPASQGSSAATKKFVCAEDMPAFRQAVNGSELSKVGLIEVLNKQFSKISKSTIKFTLEGIARRVGSKEAEKRWVLIDGCSN